MPRADVNETAPSPVDGQTFCPHKELASYYDIGEHRRALGPGRSVTPHGVDRCLDADEIRAR